MSHSESEFGIGGRIAGVSAVVPVYNGSLTIPALTGRLEKVLNKLDGGYEIVLVNDGSTDASWETILRLVAENPCVCGIDLERNYGQHNALLAGIRTARFAVVVTLDDDLQNPPEEIPKLLDALAQGWDVVYGEPQAKQHGAVRNLAGRMVVKALGFLGGRSAPMVSSFRAFRGDLVRVFDSYVGPDVSIDGLLTWSTDSFTSVRVEHQPRGEGRSNYSIPKLAAHAFTMITAFSTKPLRLATTLGFLFTIVGAVLLAYVLGRLVFEGDSVQGFPFLASAITTFSGVQLFALGVIGEYLARMHTRLMGRPSFAIREVVGGGMTGSEVSSGAAAGSPDAPESQSPDCELLSWDSDFWGFPIAAVGAPRLNHQMATTAREWARQRNVRCLYLLAESGDQETMAAAQETGFRYADSRLTLSCPGSAISFGKDAVRPVSSDEEARHREFLIDAAGPADEAETMDLASKTQRFTRFFFDPGFPRERAEVLYAQWVRRGMDSNQREVSVLRDDSGIVGYLIRRYASPDHHEIELIGVDPAARRSGYAMALVEYARAALPESGVLTTVTQGRNIAALALYEKSGLRVSRSQTWFHLWP